MRLLKKFLILILLTSNINVIADVLKPALIEATIYKDKVQLQMEVNLESIISETSTNLINTKNTKNEEYYQQLRKLSKSDLEQEFTKYKNTFMGNFDFYIDGKKTTAKLKDIKIDDVGYTKRARKSVLIFEIDKQVKDSIGWEYSPKYGDSAFRFRFFEKDNYSWNTWQIISEKLTIEVENFRPLNFWQNTLKFIQTGFYHVIPLGLDHILFIVAMTLAAVGFSKQHFLRILTLVSSFTLAHTITLGLASAEIVNVNTKIIEILIAVSIAYLAIKNLFAHYNHIKELILVFVFGLLHGLGFATMLKEFIDKDFASSLIGFNVGVELAQIIVVCATLLLIFVGTRIKIKQKLMTIPINIIIASIGLLMVFERI